MLDSLEGKRGHRALQAAASGDRRPVRQADGDQQRAEPRARCRSSSTRGGAYYRDFGVGRSRGTLAFQLAGNIKQGGLVEKAFGITARELIEGYGGGTASGRPIRAVQFGGPLGAYLPQFEARYPNGLRGVRQRGRHGRPWRRGSVRRHGRHGPAGAFRHGVLRHRESCGKCTPCRIGSVRGVEVIDRIIADENREANIELLQDLCVTMTDGSLCAMGGLTPMPVMSALRHFPDDFHRPAHAEAAE